ncbi:putative membrane protein [Micromonospora sp. A200]|uniref:heparan-alpha-glucosaminide N-acetyltransferase domain-containing protein n=1 Tax=Micromonospora sp. A200 TaxID=2940568 RepID=UPI002474BE40|nr:heparan-alpha-glucosaminide N-acetyltransferase domain-containing protein [Micromonospora sp. A200]MDH6464078.1 putative membrane protein [Micromonospora sp. A200]
MTSTIYLSRHALEEVGERPATTTSLPAQRSRLLGVDAARGVALFGMIAVHSLYVSDAAGRPTWTFTIFGGRAAALFAVLAGVGIAFITGRRRVRRTDGLGPIAGLVVRALVIGAIGLALGYTDASLALVVLPAYAVMFLMAIPLVFLPTWLVAFTGLTVAAGTLALRQILLPQLPEPTYQNPAFAHLVDHPSALLIELSVTGVYPAVAWLAYLCAGLVIGRLNLTRIRVVLSLLLTGVTFAVAAPVASSVLLNRYEGLRQIWFTQPKSGLNAAETSELLTFGGNGSTPTSTWWWLAVDAPHTSTPLDLLGTTGSAVALLAVMLLAGHVARPFPRRAISVLLLPLAAAGSMTLTLYTAHIMFISSPLDSFGAMTGYLVQVLAIVLSGTAWLATARHGPLEGVVAMLSRGARRLAAGEGRPSRVGLSTHPRAIPRARDYSAYPRTTRWRG